MLGVANMGAYLPQITVPRPSLTVVAILSTGGLLAWAGSKALRRIQVRSRPGGYVSARGCWAAAVAPIGLPCPVLAVPCRPSPRPSPGGSLPPLGVHAAHSFCAGMRVPYLLCIAPAALRLQQVPRASLGLPEFDLRGFALYMLSCVHARLMMESMNPTPSLPSMLLRCSTWARTSRSWSRG